MRILNPTISFLLFFFLIMVSSIQFSSCRYIHRSLSNEAEKTFRTEFYAEAAQGSVTDKNQSIYGASFRAVPGGPNPLHN
ncbi:hypothetical protein SLE2022_228560 [Rubroshorea leprosula]